MTYAALFLIILIIVVVLIIIIIIIKNIGNANGPLTISSRPLQITTENQGVLTSLPYNNTPTQFYINYAVFSPNTQIANQYFNIAAISSKTPDQVTIQDTASGLYLVMAQQQIFVPGGGTTRTSEYLGTFSVSLPSGATVFKITRPTSSNSYQFQLATTEQYLVVGSAVYLPPILTTPPPSTTLTALPLTVAAQGVEGTRFSLHS